MLLIPLTSLAFTSGGAAVDHWRAQRTASSVRQDALQLASLVSARAVVIDEYVGASTVVEATSLGIKPGDVDRLFGVDLVGPMQQARSRLDAALARLPQLAAERRDLQALRLAVDGGSASRGDVDELYNRITRKIADLWSAEFAALRRDALGVSDGGSLLTDRVDAVADTFAALAISEQEVRQANAAAETAATPAAVEALIADRAAVDAYASRFSGRLGTRAVAAWAALGKSEVTRTWTQTLSRVISDGLAGRRSTWTTDLHSYARSFASGPDYLRLLTAVNVAAATDLRTLAADQHAAATSGFWRAVAGLAGSVVLSLLAAGAVARQVVRPLGRLSRAARRVGNGEFTDSMVRPAGPREVADTIVAVDGMAATLAAVEAFTVTLAAEPFSAALDESMPGGAGLALQPTLGRLRESVRDGERQRALLDEAASHDALTGLLNRRAALEEVGRQLAQAQRASDRVMALFVDLDGLKAVNDRFGHQAGDEAIRQAAAALSATARAGDVVARLGGDEFLVAGPASAGEKELPRIAERLHAAVQERIIQVSPEQTVALRGCVGAALSLPGDTVDELIARADWALYAAKDAGRACVRCVASDGAALRG